MSYCRSSHRFNTVGSVWGDFNFLLCLRNFFLLKIEFIPQKHFDSEANELLIIYAKEAEQWATYLHSVFASLLSVGGICHYDISAVDRHQDHFLQMSCYTCKLLILSTGLLESLCPLRRFFLGRVLTPANHVVVLLCGVDSLAPLVELVPLNSDKCLQISSDQEAEEYLSRVMDIMGRGEASLRNILLLQEWESSTLHVHKALCGPWTSTEWSSNMVETWSPVGRVSMQLRIQKIVATFGCCCQTDGNSPPWKCRDVQQVHILWYYVVLFLLL